MICPRCKTENPDNARFCAACATPLTSAFAAAGTGSAISPATVYPATGILKKQLRSPLMLVLCLIISVQALLGLLSPLFSELFGFPASQRNALPYTLLSAAAALPVLVGVWLIFSAACEKRNPFMKDRGFAVLSVYTVIVLVCVSVLAFVELAAALVVFFAMLSGGTSALLYKAAPAFSGLSAGAAAAAVYAAVFFGVLVIVFLIVFLAKILKGLSFIRCAARSGRCRGRLSVFVFVGCFVMTAVFLISAAAYMIKGAFYSGACEILSAAEWLAAGMLAVRLYGDFIRLAENESTASGVPYSPQFHTPETVSFAPAEAAANGQAKAAVNAPADDFADAAAQRNTDFPTKSAGESASASCAPAENDASAQANPYVRIERR